MIAAAATALRYAETLRHLRAIQITNRLTRRLRPARADLSAPPPLRACAGEWAAPVERSAALSDPFEITLLNQPGSFADAAAWNDPAREKLWLYNLHYFDWLTGPGSDWDSASITRWIAQNPPGHGNGWEPYPLSLRIANWIKWLLAGGEVVEGMIASLAVQLRFLADSLEYHLLGNHLLANAKALYLGGVFFDGAEAAHWLTRGAALLREQWQDQMLADGGHDERSPMYQAILLEDVLDCANAARAYRLDGSAAAALAPRMARWLAVMSHADGDIAMFNDAAFGIAAWPAQLADYALRLGLPVLPSPAGALTALADSGYWRAELGPAVLIADMAAVGPDHQPGHAHADTLGFELSLHGQRFLVNCGTSTYAPGDQRAFERSTAAHNCTVLDGQNSSDVWAGFRTGRRARVSDILASEADGVIALAASHDGYRFLPGRPKHRRCWRLDAAGLVIEDSVTGGNATAFYHLAPGLEAVVEGTSAVISGAGREVRLTASAPLGSFASQRAAGFNRRLPATSLTLPLVSGMATLRMEW